MCKKTMKFIAYSGLILCKKVFVKICVLFRKNQCTSSLYKNYFEAMIIGKIFFFLIFEKMTFLQFSTLYNKKSKKSVKIISPVANHTIFSSTCLKFDPNNTGRIVKKAKSQDLANKTEMLMSNNFQFPKTLIHKVKSLTKKLR